MKRILLDEGFFFVNHDIDRELAERGFSISLTIENDQHYNDHGEFYYGER